MSEKIASYPAPRTNKMDASPIYEERAKPEAYLYPGLRPESAFCTSGDEVLGMQVSQSGDSLNVSIVKDNGRQEDLDKYLENHEVVPLAERVAIVGFGSNANPSQLVKKFMAAENEGDKTIVPTLTGKIHNTAPGYVPRISILGGYVPANLVYAPGSVTNVAINLLSPEQFKLMNESEGSSYKLCKYGSVTIDGTKLSIPAYIYIEEEGSLINAKGEPILIAGITENPGTGEVMTQKEVLEFIGSEIGLELSKYNPEFKPQFFEGDDAKQLEWFFKQNAPAGMHTAEEIVSNVLYGWIQRRIINRARGFKRRYAARNAISELLQRNGLSSKEWSLLDRIPEQDIMDGKEKTPKKISEFLKLA